MENGRTSCSPVGVLRVAIEQKAQDVLCVYYQFCFDVSLPTMFVWKEIDSSD